MVYISIHAPAKGATTLRKLNLHFSLISIHAPAKGATEITENGKTTRSISIHAPVKGATCGLSGKELRKYIISIHAPAKGATFAGKCSDGSDAFQSTLPRRERPIDDCARAHERRRQVSPSSARANTIP